MCLQVSVYPQEIAFLETEPPRMKAPPDRCTPWMYALPTGMECTAWMDVPPFS